VRQKSRNETQAERLRQIDKKVEQLLDEARRGKK